MHSVLAKSRQQERSAILINKVSADDDEFVTLYIVSDRMGEGDCFTVINGPVRCISFVGNSIGGTEFRDKSGNDADGNAVHMYNYIISFLTRNLRHKQVEKDFNSPGELEVSMTSLSEIVANGILHRSYVIEAPLRVFIFDNRIEIHSPVYVR